MSGPFGYWKRKPSYVLERRTDAWGASIAYIEIGQIKRGTVFSGHINGPWLRALRKPRKLLKELEAGQ